MKAMASLGGGAGGPPRVTPSRGLHPNDKSFVGKFTKNSGQTRSDRLKRRGVTPFIGGGDTRV